MKCCNYDYNEDGNCHIHRHPGVYRDPIREEANKAQVKKLIERLAAEGTILWLDDMRTPLDKRIKVVRSYVEFVAYLELHKGKPTFPKLICFDHDLAPEHYPKMGEEPFRIPYSTYTIKTGKECAEYVTTNDLPVEYFSVHSHSPNGRSNIESVLLRHFEIHNWLPGIVDFIPFMLTPIEGVSRYGYRVDDEGELQEIEELMNEYNSDPAREF
jgi:hypothetical protein